MNIGTLCRKTLALACVAGSALGGEATQRVADERLEQIIIPGERERPRERGPLKDATPTYNINVARRNAATTARLTTVGNRREVNFRRASAARRVLPEIGGTTNAVRSEASRNRVRVGNTWLSAALLAVDDNVDEVRGPPASIPFGAHSALVNLDHVRLLDTRRTLITVVDATDPQTRRCTPSITLLDDDLDSTNRFLLLHDSQAECQNVMQGRVGDLLFAEDVPQPLRQAVQEVYGPINVGLGNRLGSEPGLVFVAARADAARDDWRFERSWDRSSLLLFDGAAWQRGIRPRQRQALWAAFAQDQIFRRFRQADHPGVHTEAAALYLLGLFTAEQTGNTRGWLAEAVPEWIASCAADLDDRVDGGAGEPDATSLQCGLVVQFVYDAFARARSAGRASLFDTWKSLLDESWRRGKAGADPKDFLDSAREARRIAQGVMDGGVDWVKFAGELADLGVWLRLDEDVPGASVAVLSLQHFRDRP